MGIVFFQEALAYEHCLIDYFQMKNLTNEAVGHSPFTNNLIEAKRAKVGQTLTRVG